MVTQFEKRRTRKTKIYNCMVLTSQVTVEFADEARRLNTLEKAELLQRLAAALDRVSEDVKGLTLLLGAGYGMDAQGRVRLYHRDSALMWSR